MRIGCGGRFELQQQDDEIEIRSPNFPDPPPVAECDWLIIGRPASSLRIDFDLGTGIACSSTDRSLSVYDGGSTQSPLLAQSCPRRSSVSSTDNVMLIRFVATAPGLQDAFTARVKHSVCGGTYVISVDSLLRTKNYPNSYPPNMRCDYILRSHHPDHNLLLTINRLDLKSKPGNPLYTGRDAEECDGAGDVVEIRDHDSNGQVLARYCGQSNLTISLPTPSSQAFVSFRSDSSDAGSGFQMHIQTNYRSKCDTGVFELTFMN